MKVYFLILKTPEVWKGTAAARRPNIAVCLRSACRALSRSRLCRGPRPLHDQIRRPISLPRSLQWKVFWFLELIPGSYSGLHPLPRVSGLDARPPAEKVAARKRMCWMLADLFYLGFTLWDRWPGDAGRDFKSTRVRGTVIRRDPYSNITGTTLPVDLI